MTVAVKEILGLEYLDGNGWGCRYPGEEDSQARRWFHHFTFYGFMLCFAATTVGVIYHYVFGWHAPHGYLSLPVILGTLGGLGLLVGPVGLLSLKFQRNRDITDGSQFGMDASFLVLLFLTSLTGLLLLIFRETAAMGFLLIIHLGYRHGPVPDASVWKVRSQYFQGRGNRQVCGGTQKKADYRRMRMISAHDLLCSLN